MAEQTHDKNFNMPVDIPASPPDYYFGLGMGPHNTPALEAVKTWMSGDERRFDTFTIAEYGMYEEAANEEKELTEMHTLWGVESAMNLAEKIAVAGGYLDSNREDGRVFFADDAPPDPFTTVRERALEAERARREPPAYAVDAISANGSSHLDVVKTWGEDEHAHLIIPQPSWEMAAANAQAAYDMMLKDDLQGAMTLVELAGVEAGVIQPDRDNPRLFTEGPPDPFTTIRERELALPEMETEPLAPIIPITGDPYAAWAEEARREREANAVLEGAAWFEATFEKSETTLLQPIHDTVNYAVVVQDTDPWTRELMVEKYWREPHGYLGSSSLTIDTYDSDDETERAVADAAHKALLDVHKERGLEAIMHQAELGAMKNGHLDGNRIDLRLFLDGPPDRFETLAQRLENEPNPYWSIGDDVVSDERDELAQTQGLPAFMSTAGTWDDLVADQTDDEPERERHYWQIHHRPVETPDGERLGTALFVTEFPQLPPDFDAYIDKWGMDDSIYPTEARTVEIAHFANDEDARRFEDEFRGYLVPDLLDAPELAPEVAKLEGLAGEWHEMDYDAIVSYMSGRRTITHELNNWHLHNPNAERAARIDAEGLAVNASTTLPENNTAEIELKSPDFDL